MNKSETEIFPLKVGYSNVVLLKNRDSAILIDTGLKGHLHQLTRFFEHKKVLPVQIRLIVLTHTHHDHTGNLEGLAKLTGAPVLVHKNEFANLKNGFTPIPRGITFNTKLISGIGRLLLPRFASPKAFTADLVNKDVFSLENFGIDAKVISTPGHTEGSQSILVGTTLISGDTFINIKDGMIFPHFVNNPKQLLETWQKLFEMRIENVYPGHGKPFRIEKAWPEFERWKKKFIS